MWTHMLAVDRNCMVQHQIKVEERPGTAGMNVGAIQPSFRPFPSFVKGTMRPKIAPEVGSERNKSLRIVCGRKFLRTVYRRNYLRLIRTVQRVHCMDRR
jgi:hypothetical protein